MIASMVKNNTRPVRVVGSSAAVFCRSIPLIGCSAAGPGTAISMPGKWSYLLGHLGAQKTHDVLTYARTYRASKTGLVLPSKRPASLHDAVLGRMPSLVPAPEETA